MRTVCVPSHWVTQHTVAAYRRGVMQCRTHNLSMLSLVVLTGGSQKLKGRRTCASSCCATSAVHKRADNHSMHTYASRHFGFFIHAMQVDLSTFINDPDPVEARLTFAIWHGFIELPDAKQPATKADGEVPYGITLLVVKLEYREVKEPESDTEHGFPDEYRPSHHSTKAQPANAADGAGPSAQRASSPPAPASHAPVPPISTPAGKDARSSTHQQSRAPGRATTAAAVQQRTPPQRAAPLAGASPAAEHHVVPSKHACPSGEQQHSPKRQEGEHGEHVHGVHSAEEAARDE